MNISTDLFFLFQLAAPLSSAISSLDETIAMATQSIDEEIRIVDEMMTRISFLQRGVSTFLAKFN